MQNTMANPLATEKISKLILKFSVPSIASFLVNAIYNIVDQIFIGHMGESVGMLGIAATNIAFPLVTICTALALLLGVGTASNFNLQLGAGNKDNAAKIAGNGLVLMLSLGTILAVLSLIFNNQLLVLFGVTDKILPYAEPYLRIICIGMPFQVFTTGACQLIRSDGSPTYSMACLMSGAVLNTILDPILIFVFNWGISGAAIATVMSQILTALVAMIYMIKKFRTVKIKKEYLKPQLPYIKKISSLGMAACLNQIAITIIQILMNNTLSHYGGISAYGSEIPLACVGAISKINVIFLAFVIGLAQGCQPIIGFNYGAKNYKRVKKTFITALITATIFSTLIFAVFQLFPREVMSIFGEGTEEYFRFAERYLRIFLLMTFINGIQPITANFFTSIGKPIIGVFMSLTRQIIFLLPLLIILPMYMGIDGVVYAGPISDGAAAIVTLLFILREIRILDKLIHQTESQ